VTAVNDAAPAVAAAASSACDIILLEVSLPEMDGATPSRDIRELGDRADGVQIIALTAGVLFGKDHKQRSAGMTDHVSGPIEVALLVAALRRASSRTNFDRSRAWRSRPALSQTSRFPRGAVARSAPFGKHEQHCRPLVLLSQKILEEIRIASRFCKLAIR